MIDQKKAIEKLRKSGFRITPQRQMVIGALMSLGSHANALEVYEAVIEDFPSINKATVYRTLDFFCDEGITTRTEINGRIFYEIAGEEPHHHLHCTQCGEMAHLDNHHFTELIHHLAQEHNFHADLNHLHISGVCGPCFNKSEK